MPTKVYNFTVEYPDSDEEIAWTEWSAGEWDASPMPSDAFVEIEVRHGDRAVEPVKHLMWSEIGSATIVRYRVVKDSVKDPGWKPWDPDVSARPEGIVQVRLRDGTRSDSRGRPSKIWSWSVDKDWLQAGDIIAYKVLEKKMQSTSTETIRWKPTLKAKCPLPEDTMIETKLRGAEESDWGTSPAGHWSWVGSKRRGTGEIIAYRVLGPIEDGWHPFDPSKDSKRPCGMGEVVEIRTRQGDLGRGHAHKFSWRHNLRNRDADIVAWRKVSSREA